MLQNGEIKNQHQESHQRETKHDKFAIVAKLRRQKDNRVSKIRVYSNSKWYMCWRNFCVLSLVTKKWEEYVKVPLFKNESRFEIWFRKLRKQLQFLEENYLTQSG